MALLDTAIVHFASFHKSVEAAQSFISNWYCCFSGAVSNGRLARFVNKHCHYFGCNSAIDINPLSHGAVILTRPFSQTRNELSAKIAPFLSISENTAVSGWGLLSVSCSCSAITTNIFSRRLRFHNSEHTHNGFRQRLNYAWRPRALKFVRGLLLPVYERCIQCIIFQCALKVL